MAMLSLSEQQQLANFIGIGQHLYQLDNEPIRPIGEMTQLLMETPPAADSVATIFPVHTDLVEQAHGKLMGDVGLSDYNKSQWKQMVTWYGNPGHLVVKAAKWVSQRAPQEEAGLTDSSGALSGEFWCAFYVAIAVAAGLLQQWEAAFPAAVIAGAVCGTASAESGGGGGGGDGGFPSAHNSEEED